MRSSLVKFAKQLAVILILFYVASRWFLTREWERAYSNKPSASSDEAREIGSLIRRMPLATRYLRVGARDSARIVDAWIERKTLVRFRYLFFRTRIPAGDALLAFVTETPPRPPRAPWYTRYVEGDSVTIWNEFTLPSRPVVYYRLAEEPFQDSLRFSLCEYKVDRDGDSVANTMRWLKPCPPVK